MAMMMGVRMRWLLVVLFVVEDGGMREAQDLACGVDHAGHPAAAARPVRGAQTPSRLKTKQGKDNIQYCTHRIKQYKPKYIVNQKCLLITMIKQ